MAKGEYTCDVDTFAATLDDILGDVALKCNDKVSRAVEQSTRKGVKTVKAKAKETGVHKWSDEYVGGFSSHIKKGAMSEGEIGNKAKPGLVHLLEKGHATLTGRRTRAFPHMAPAFEEMQDDLIERVEKAVGEALR